MASGADVGSALESRSKSRQRPSGAGIRWGGLLLTLVEIVAGDLKARESGEGAAA
jgi:hypothetical protein